MSTQTPREIAFEDIRAGDEIEVVWVRGDRTDTSRGVAGRKPDHGDAWYTHQGLLLLLREGVAEGRAILLHDRPAPAEPKGLGAVVRAHLVAWSCSPALFVLTPPCAEGGEILPDWVDRNGDLYYWSQLDPESIEVLSEGIEVES